jgi:hypothetical protein
MHSSIFVHALLKSFPCLRELLVILSDNVEAFNRVKPSGSLSPAFSVVSMLEAVVYELVDN